MSSGLTEHHRVKGLASPVPGQTDADVGERGVEHVFSVRKRLHPRSDHAGRIGLVIGDVLTQKLIAVMHEGCSISQRRERHAWKVVLHLIEPGHVLRMELGSFHESGVRAERGKMVLAPDEVGEIDDRLGDDFALAGMARAMNRS